MGFYSHTKSSFFCCHDDNKKEPNNPSDSAKSKYIFLVATEREGLEPT